MSVSPVSRIVAIWPGASVKRAPTGADWRGAVGSAAQAAKAMIAAISEVGFVGRRMLYLTRSPSATSPALALLRPIHHQ